MAQGLEQADAKAHATAAQIWAEMLGLVCHPEYYKLGEQKVMYPSIHTDSRLLSYTLWATTLVFITRHFPRNISSQFNTKA